MIAIGNAGCPIDESGAGVAQHTLPRTSKRPCNISETDSEALHNSSFFFSNDSAGGLARPQVDPHRPNATPICPRVIPSETPSSFVNPSNSRTASRHWNPNRHCLQQVRHPSSSSIIFCRLFSTTIGLLENAAASTPRERSLDSNNDLSPE